MVAWYNLGTKYAQHIMLLLLKQIHFLHGAEIINDIDNNDTYITNKLSIICRTKYINKK